ncbi:hypothetical protein KUV44_00100 [Marinobacter daepoensis]|uniref:Uncharacterized protein n=1 Tax=Marinobacter daepoensis TaxID=262077 RepID=A0ABS3BBK4_9GAMM|nr:hypothetical protein [Marinobacter daepoensis]MBN7768847.1 hypothetical protein [Marinobacter daepoensis]MBY6077537.1 hypothetical protein [Marinobacter daepoensis]
MLRKYRLLRLKALCWLAQCGSPKRVIAFQDGTPSENYDCYFLSLIPKRIDEGRNILRFAPTADGTWGWNFRVSGETTPVVISDLHLKNYKLHLVHYFYDKTSVYRYWVWPAFLRLVGISGLRAFLRPRVFAPLGRAFGWLKTSANDRFRRPQNDRYLYLRACVRLGYAGHSFSRSDVLMKVYGTADFGEEEGGRRNSVAALILSSLISEGAIRDCATGYALNPEALTIYQSMSEERDRYQAELTHNSSIRILTTVIAVGVLFNIGGTVWVHHKEYFQAYDRLIGVENLSLEAFVWLTLITIAVSGYKIASKLRSKSSPKVEF